jgi:signal transduction histidine kinase/ActR/RegA family two-component response regulator
MKNYKKFFYFFAFVLFAIFFVILNINYLQMEKVKKEILQIQANNLIQFINAFNKVYQDSFEKYKIPINEKTVHLMPVVEIRDIAKEFSKRVNAEVEIKMISTNPRNPHNMANEEEAKILSLFQKNQKKYIMKTKNNEIFYYKPLYISKTCLQCHLSKEKTPSYIKDHYDNSYGYKIGDLKGAIVVIIRKSVFLKLLKQGFIIRVISAIIIYLMILIIVFILLRKIEALDKKYISELISANEKLEKEKEKAEQATKVKSEFLANMSHEIRTPLNSMFGFIKLLEEKIKDKENKENLNIIKKSGEILLNIINDILDFSKIEAGKFSIEKIAFNLKDELNIIYKLFQNTAKEENIKLHIDEKNTDVCIVTDPTRLKQIISNLLSNAIKFTPEGKNVYLIVKYDDNSNELYVEVKDEGIGIPKDKLEIIFKAFSQADSSTTRQYGGTGLGLSISSSLVKFLGGTLQVESEEGKGSRFYFTIPVQKSKKNTQKETKVVDDKKYNYHILLVEDNKANQMFMKVILKKLGLTFDIANDGIEAIELYKKNYDKYKLILMDENMPNMTGSEATVEIRRFEKENNLSPVFIVALTANVLTDQKNRFVKIGMDDYLSKPLDIEKLKNILNKIN